MRIPVELPKAYCLINHGPTVLVTSAHAGHRNVMAAAWNTGLDFNPSRVVVVIDKNTWTRELVEASGVFVLNVPSRALAQATLAVGSITGRAITEGDKFSHCRIETFPATKIDVPMVEGCVGWMECKVIDEPHNQKTYDLFIGEVVAAWANPRVFSDGHWHFTDDDSLRTIHYVAGGNFMTIGESFDVKS